MGGSILICSVKLFPTLLLLTKMRIDIAEHRNEINALRNELRSTAAEIATMNRQLMAVNDMDRNQVRQLETDIRAKQRQKDEIKDKISCLELEIKNAELQERIADNNRRLETARQRNNELRSRFENERTFSQGRKG